MTLDLGFCYVSTFQTRHWEVNRVLGARAENPRWDHHQDPLLVRETDAIRARHRFEATSTNCFEAIWKRVLLSGRLCWFLIVLEASRFNRD